jgi:hypothetical protein
VSRSVRIGSGAGFSGDRIAPAVDLVTRGALQDVVLECLAERTVALGQQRRRQDPGAGHDPRTAAWLRALLPEAVPRGTRIVSNLGAANPVAAGRVAVAVARELGVSCRVAVVTGDDVLDVLDLDQPCLEDGRPLRERGEIVSANAYLGADALSEAMRSEAAVVLTGRVADPSLFLATLAHRHGWDLADVPHAAAGTLVGHLLECGAQATGGYFADPGIKEVRRLHDLGYPFADVAADGTAVLGKLDGTGGRLDRQTVREQLLYEVGDPAAYVTPDVVLDVLGVRLDETAPDRVAVCGAAGRPRPDRLKVSVGYRAGHRAEASITYAGPGCVERARLAGDVVLARTKLPDLRVDVFGSVGDEAHAQALLRVAGMSPTDDEAREVAAEVESLYTNGPAGGGGVRTAVTEVVGIASALVDRDQVVPTTTILEA